MLQLLGELESKYTLLASKIVVVYSQYLGVLGSSFSS